MQNQSFELFGPFFSPANDWFTKIGVFREFLK